MNGKKKVKSLEIPKFVLVKSASGMRGLQPKALRLDILSNSVNVLVSQLDLILNRVPESVSKFRLDEFSISVEISAKGELSILGTGGGIEGKGGMEFKFKRT